MADHSKDKKNVNNALKNAPDAIKDRFKITAWGIEITGEVNYTPRPKAEEGQ